MSSRPKKPAQARAPAERSTTVRAQLREELSRGPQTARSLSTAVGLREREISDHLEHLSRSLGAHGERLAVEPASCLACGYAFKDRRRLTTPSRCPKCGSERIEPPAFQLHPEGGR